MFQPTLLLTCYLLLAFYLLTCLPSFISSFNKHLLNTEYFLHARPELDAILKAQIKCYGHPKAGEKKRGMECKGKGKIGHCSRHLHMQCLGDFFQPPSFTAEETEAQKGGATCPKSSVTRHHRSNCREGKFCREANMGRDAHIRYKGFRWMQVLIVSLVSTCNTSFPSQVWAAHPLPSSKPSLII